ncbi:YjdJ family protein [Gottfriedia acidiceleris]|uniref:YjdJ family protein n=1 Tax=Gottfriedia acidiceleris TaxID=371036 RepID=UPI002F264D58
MIRLSIQFILALILLIFSTFASWYEGSEILDKPWEWKYSTPFTKLFYEGNYNVSNISHLDYFVYAVKFKPTYPIIMLVSILYLLIIIGYFYLKPRIKWLAYYQFILGGGFIILSYLVFQSPTLGGQTLYKIFILSAIFCIGASIITYLQIFNLIRMKLQINHR